MSYIKKKKGIIIKDKVSIQIEKRNDVGCRLSAEEYIK
jgi:hypothetical protein